MNTSASTSTKSPDSLPVIRYEPRGEAVQLFYSHDPEIVLCGPAGTGKTRVCLEKLHLLCSLIPRLRCLIARKTYAALKASALVTFDEQVQPAMDGVRFWGPTKKRPAQYVYPNGSVIVVGGMDDARKVLSTDYDVIYVPQGEELEEADYDALSSRCRNYRIPWQQLMLDVNPDAPTHFVKRRADAGKLLMLYSRHEDNPRLYDAESGQWTAEGIDYIARLENLSGVRYQRLRLGEWAAAEGMIYSGAWDSSRNLIYRQRISARPDTLSGDCGIDRTWPRLLTFDYGFTNPFVAQFWARDPDGRLYLYREIYMSNRLIADHAATLKQYARWGEPDGDPWPYRVVGDPAGGEAKKHLGQLLGMSIEDAPNDVKTGIDLVATRMKAAADGLPRLMICRDSLVERDPVLEQAKKPCSTAEEIPGYVWGDEAKEKPKKVNDHGCDDMRYLVAAEDLNTTGLIQIGPRIVR